MVKQNILIFGASGMIGSVITDVLSEKKNLLITGVIRVCKNKQFKNKNIKLINYKYDLFNLKKLKKIFNDTKPNFVINCAGITKQKIKNENIDKVILINAVLPHILYDLSKIISAKFIQISTDCVFSGDRGNYSENDTADATDLYGKSKALGEIISKHAITLRTSTIGHEFKSKKGLLEWFLSQNVKCEGYEGAIFSGLPTIEFAEVIRDLIIPNKKLNGLFHIASKPINKYKLLELISKKYRKKIKLIKNKSFRVNKSLNSKLFFKKTGYSAPSWNKMIDKMYNYHYKKKYERLF